MKRASSGGQAQADRGFPANRATDLFPTCERGVARPLPTSQATLLGLREPRWRVPATGLTSSVR